MPLETQNYIRCWFEIGELIRHEFVPINQEKTKCMEMGMNK